MKWILGLLAFVFLSAEEPGIVYLTWQKNPESTMVVHWITDPNETSDRLQFRKAGAADWESGEGSHAAMPDKLPYLIHAIELTELEPGSSYEFKFENSVYSFLTAPKDLEHEITFVVGGDIYHDEIERVGLMNTRAAMYNPLFVVVGGDLAYSKVSLLGMEDGSRWITWLKNWFETMRVGNRLIPMIPVIGNHDVNTKGLQNPAKAPFFYFLFSLPPENGYRVINFKDYLSLYALDSHHTHPISGEQTEWLEENLAKGGKFKFAVYHIGAYPAYRNPNSKESQLLRKNWSPLFEKYHLTAAFEHHDHLYKRTFPMKEGKRDKDGIVYFGDGAWGTKKLRSPAKREYLAKAVSSQNIIVVTLSSQNALFRAIQPNGEVIDEYRKVLP